LDRTPSMEIAGLLPAPVPSPKPPAWSNVEMRPHILQVDLKEVELRPEAPDLEPAWYQSTHYFVSFHPTSESATVVPLPREPPSDTRDGQQLVSRIMPAKQPTVKVKGADDDISLVTFEDELVLSLDRLENLMIVYLWGKTSSMMTGGGEHTLMGRNVIHLVDFNSQRKQLTLSFLDIGDGDCVADMRFSYMVASTPGPVERPWVSEATKSELTLRWEAPRNDHGAPLVGYQVAIAETDSGGAHWTVLCQCTSTLNPCYVVTNLAGNTPYLFDIRAVNKVGVGDSREFEACTAPVEPGPPNTPYIAEVREGCLCIAWRSPESHGGAEISAYRVRMRKILGASKWNPFGPGEGNAVWVEMGTVGALMEDEEKPPAYSAWVGPLEDTACEYRFEIVALNRTGAGKGSVLSEPHYT